MVPTDVVGPSLFRFEGATLLGRVPVTSFLLRALRRGGPLPRACHGHGVFCRDPGVCRSAP
jgi:hypothetical protein